jgi:O-methyltransferase involved in polyketide biosynthesis
VALGKGLETQFWRVGNGRVTWLSVDLPESISLRDELLPGSPRQRRLARSALIRAGWTRSIPPAGSS